ncbi:MAG: hypothetical protein HYY17_06700 [Planctomycetes bacterium]|nr:hypothetical protein [Planctomycetota bacterium]
MRDYRRIRAQMSDRLARARRQGRLDEEMAAIEREGRRVYREALAEVRKERLRAKKHTRRKIATA